MLGKNCVKNFRVTKIVKQIKFEEVWGNSEARNCFQKQSFTKYLRQTIVSCEIAHYGKSSISVFQEISTSTDKISFWVED